MPGIALARYQKITYSAARKDPAILHHNDADRRDGLNAPWNSARIVVMDVLTENLLGTSLESTLFPSKPHRRHVCHAQRNLGQTGSI